MSQGSPLAPGQQPGWGGKADVPVAQLGSPRGWGGLLTSVLTQILFLRRVLWRMAQELLILLSAIPFQSATSCNCFRSPVWCCGSSVAHQVPQGGCWVCTRPPLPPSARCLVQLCPSRCCLWSRWASASFRALGEPDIWHQLHTV